MSPDRYPEQYAAVKNNLAITYLSLSEAVDKAGNCRRALQSCSDALLIRTLDAWPQAYAATQNNLGNAYLNLAEEEEGLLNCQRALETYKKALRIYS